MKRVALVGCSRTKLAHAAPARDLYSSNLFRAAIEFAEREFEEVRILSALHGAIRPERIVAPYDECLDSYDAEELAEWGHSVMVHQLGAEFDTTKPLDLVVFAGERYTQPLFDHLVDFPMWSIEEPLSGRGIGQRLAWFKSRRAA